MGNGARPLRQGCDIAASGGGPGHRRRRTGEHIHQRLPGHLSHIRHTRRGVASADRALRKTQNNRSTQFRPDARATQKDAHLGAARVARRLSRGLVDATAAIDVRIHRQTPAQLRHLHEGEKENRHVAPAADQRLGAHHLLTGTLRGVLFGAGVSRPTVTPDERLSVSARVGETLCRAADTHGHGAVQAANTAPVSGRDVGSTRPQRGADRRGHGATV